jgi:hypothetical protein
MLSPSRSWLALVHHPCYDRAGRVVSTALTTLDLHDIARSSRTYGLAGVLIVHPVAAQRAMAERICGHWLDGADGTHDFRRAALERVSVVDTVETACDLVRARAGERPILVGTTARRAPDAVGYAAFAATPPAGDRPTLLLFGTGYGLTDELLARCDVRLAPVSARDPGPSPYNHLSVRSACAIVLDRLYGDRP